MSTSGKSIFYWVVLYFYIFFAWNYYHLVTQFPAWVDEIVFKPFVELSPVLFVVFWVEKERWSSLGFSGKNLPRNVLLGMVIGIVLILGRFMIKKIVTQGVTINPHHLTTVDFLLFAITCSVVGFLEETIFRGYFFQRLWWNSGNQLKANILTSWMFALAHVPFVVFILHYSLLDLFFYVMQIIVMGIMFAFIFARTKSIFPSMVAHTIWKFSNALFI